MQHKSCLRCISNCSYQSLTPGASLPLLVSLAMICFHQSEAVVYILVCYSKETLLVESMFGFMISPFKMKSSYLITLSCATRVGGCSDSTLHISNRISMEMNLAFVLLPKWLTSWGMMGWEGGCDNPSHSDRGPTSTQRPE